MLRVFLRSLSKCTTPRKCSISLSPPENSHHRRPLPNHLVPFASSQGRVLFKEALLDGNMENYFPLVGNFTSQSDVAMCGPGTLAMVLNALEVDPKQVWKGIWRWYSDDMLECCEKPKADIRESGITFDQFLCLARCHGLKAVPFRSGSLNDFRQAAIKSSTIPNQHLVVSFSRQSMEQTGIGHFSPIAGYHKDSDMALVLDVARFKYPSYWVSLERLWKAMEPVDPDTNLPRGFIALST